MAHVRDDFVAESANNAGLAAFDLAGAINGAHVQFGDFMADNDTTEYAAKLYDSDGVTLLDFETGIGTYDAGNNWLERAVTPAASSNGGSPVNFGAGSVIITCSPLAGTITDLEDRATALEGGSVTITDWTVYTPTFTGFGTVTVHSLWWKRVGDTLHLRGNFTSGTPTAVEARISLPTGLSSDATKVPALQLAGKFLINAAYAYQASVIIGSNLAYINVSIQDGTYSGLVARTGSNLTANGVIVSINAEIPIAGW